VLLIVEGASSVEERTRMRCGMMWLVRLMMVLKGMGIAMLVKGFP
jgi:hypothetical protein